MSASSIHFVTRPDHRYTHELFAHEMQSRFDLPVFVSDYWTLGTATLKDAIVVMCDLERFTSDTVSVVAQAEEDARCRGARVILNSPSRVKRRLELLIHLYTTGLNTFQAFPVGTPVNQLHFPVFLRKQHEHNGPRSALLYNEAAFTTALSQNTISPPDLIVEFVDCRETGIHPFHKYGAVGWCGKVLPRHLFFSDKWVVKQSTVVNEDYLSRER